MSLALEQDLSAPPTLGEFALNRLDALCAAIGVPEGEQHSARSLVKLVSDGWGDMLVRDRPWPNDLTDDGTPFEFSLGFETSKPDLRLLFESQPDAHGATWKSGLSLQSRLRAAYACDSSLFERIAAPFAPARHTSPRFSLWHALVFGAGGASLFKAYVNPEVHGVERSRSLAAQAFTQLGLSDAWRFVEHKLADATRLPYLSVDLRAPQAARVKLYLTASNADSVLRLVEGSSNVPPEAARAWLERLTQSSGPYAARPILVCYGFRPGQMAPEATVHVPVRCYAPNDEEAIERTVELLSKGNRVRLRKAMQALTRAPLSHSKGVLSYVSLRVVEGRVRLTTYLAPGAYTTADDSRESGTIPTLRPAKA